MYLQQTVFCLISKIDNRSSWSPGLHWNNVDLDKGISGHHMHLLQTVLKFDVLFWKFIGHQILHFYVIKVSALQGCIISSGFFNWTNITFFLKIALHLLLIDKKKPINANFSLTTNEEVITGNMCWQIVIFSYWHDSNPRKQWPLHLHWLNIDPTLFSKIKACLMSIWRYLHS